MHPKEISIADFTYSLPEEKIAAFPLEQRDDSRLLIYRDGNIDEDIYKNIAASLPGKSLLIFNNTKVIRARILFKKATGGIIEIFCLEPYETINEYSTIMNKKERVRWKCLVGGAGKWKEGSLVKTSVDKGYKLEARLAEKLPGAYIVEFSWQPVHLSFAEVIEQMGDMPLPPYIKRKAAASDKERYQTLYAKHEGSVAAPTAGLHFTAHIFQSLQKKNISVEYVTLHVGAGTFKPVKSASLALHEMHAEWIDITFQNIRVIYDNQSNLTVAVGTTSLRTIESLYWMGIKTILCPWSKMGDLMIHQWDIYEEPLRSVNITVKESLSALLNWMKTNNQERIIIQTQILIAPGYEFKMAGALITNFHQPQSTLLLLVAAAIGDDWRRVYKYALENNFRFLSYGDGSLLYLTAPISKGA